MGGSGRRAPQDLNGTPAFRREGVPEGNAGAEPEGPGAKNVGGGRGSRLTPAGRADGSRRSVWKTKNGENVRSAPEPPEPAEKGSPDALHGKRKSGAAGGGSALEKGCGAEKSQAGDVPTGRGEGVRFFHGLLRHPTLFILPYSCGKSKVFNRESLYNDLYREILFFFPGSPHKISGILNAGGRRAWPKTSLPPRSSAAWWRRIPDRSAATGPARAARKRPAERLREGRRGPPRRRPGRRRKSGCPQRTNVPSPARCPLRANRRKTRLPRSPGRRPAGTSGRANHRSRPGNPGRIPARIPERTTARNPGRTQRPRGNGPPVRAETRRFRHRTRSG